MADELSVKMMRDPDLALETHAREELGFAPGETGNPIQAALSSFVMFALGAFIPLLPWLITSGTKATLWSIGLGAVASLAVGAALSIFTGRSWLWSASRQFLISAGGGRGHVLHRAPGRHPLGGAPGRAQPSTDPRR